MVPAIETVVAERTRSAGVRKIRRAREATEPSRKKPSAHEEPKSDARIRPVCEMCDQPARVHVLEGYQDGQPVIRRFCLACAPDAAAAQARSNSGRSKLRLSILVGIFGLGLGALALFGDQILPMKIGAGFGLHKGGGLVVGALLLLIGTLSRADLIAIGGLFVFAASLGAGLFGWMQSPGFGWKQQMLLDLSGICVILCVLGRLGIAAGVRKAARSVIQNRPKRNYARPHE